MRKILTNERLGFFCLKNRAVGLESSAAIGKANGIAGSRAILGSSRAKKLRSRAIISPSRAIIPSSRAIVAPSRAIIFPSRAIVSPSHAIYSHNHALFQKIRSTRMPPTISDNGSANDLAKSLINELTECSFIV